jgi:hypothetical protein
MIGEYRLPLVGIAWRLEHQKHTKNTSISPDYLHNTSHRNPIYFIFLYHYITNGTGQYILARGKLHG